MKLRLLSVIFLFITMVYIFYYQYKINSLKNEMNIQKENCESKIGLIKEYQEALYIYMIKDSLGSEKLIKIMDSLNGGNLDNHKN